MKIFLLFAFTLISLGGKAQSDSLAKTKPVFLSLRLVMTLVDTTAHPFPYQAGNKYKLYEFRINTLYRGEHDGEKIWVIATEQEILQFNNPKRPGMPYYWILVRKMILPDGKVIYRKGGAW